jgi:hypothetical protein
VVAVMNAATYAAIMGVAFTVGWAALAALAIYLIERTPTRPYRPAERPRDPYAEAQALAARRHAEHVGRVPEPFGRLPVAAIRGGES